MSPVNGKENVTTPYLGLNDIPSHFDVLKRRVRSDENQCKSEAEQERFDVKDENRSVTYDPLIIRKDSEMALVLLFCS